MTQAATQNNSGEFVRAALGDYVEVQSLSARVDDLLALLPLETLDLLARTNENFFYRRFGFRARYKQRAAFLEGKNAFGLTDEELRFLRRVGCARPQRDRVVFSVTLVDATVGALSMLMLLPLIAPSIFALATIKTWTLGGLAVILGALALCGVLGWASYQLYLRPRRVLGEYCKRVFVGEPAAGAG